MWIYDRFVRESSLGEVRTRILSLEKFKAHSFDLVILDIKMPDLNGFALYPESG
jgi:YesN/AraC family two-component response regulator